MDNDKIQAFLREFTTKTGEGYEVPPEGSLGLLALGDIGLIAWRLKRQAVQTESTTKKVATTDE